MVQKVHLIIKGMNGDYDLTLYFFIGSTIWTMVIVVEDYSRKPPTESYNKMEHFWHYFDVIYVKQYFQEKNRFTRI